MKRFLLLSLMAMLTLSAWAQPKITSPSMDLSVSVKRCFVKGNTAFVDLILENTSTKDIDLWVRPERATDDEGCSYLSSFFESESSLYLIAEGKNVSNYKYFIPAEGFIRIRAGVKELDEYANAFQYLSFAIDPSGFNRDPKLLIIRNLPITRD